MTSRLWATDFAVVVVVTFGVQLAWIGPHWTRSVDTPGSQPGPSYSALSALIVVGWMLALSMSGSRSHRVLGSGPEEYRRLLTASVWMFGMLAVLAYSLQYSVARGYVAITFPLGLLALAATRWMWRQWLNAQRRRGSMASKVLIVGTEDEAVPLARHIERFHTSGLQVAGIFRSTFGERTITPAAVAREATVLGVSAVAVTPSAHLEPGQLRDLRWALEDLDADLIVAPALTGIAGPRVHSRPIEGLPLLHIDSARYDGVMRYVKESFDRAFSLVALVVLSPVFLLLGALVKATSPGPAFYQQERVGLDGRAFHIWKFRSMRKDADSELMGRLHAQGKAGVPLFKLTNDDRVTGVGRVMRKWSLDELPQLFNVLRGDMSLVGPRPQRPAEVALYDHAALRRLKIKPGLTGLWQVSGRSDLPWEEAVEMDLYYVENWSFSFDILLIWRTLFAVVRGSGAH